jgi:hypothetical protein
MWQAAWLRAWQQHAEIERAQVFLLGEPGALLDQLAVHQRDLPGWPAERHHANAGEHAKCFSQGWCSGGCHGRVIPDGKPDGKRVRPTVAHLETFSTRWRQGLWICPV